MIRIITSNLKLIKGLSLVLFCSVSLYSQLPVNLQNLPAGKSITICYEVEVTEANPDATQITEQINIEYDDPINSGERIALMSDNPNDPTSASDPTLVAFEIQAIPTLSQWSILILSLVIWIFGICQIKTTISTRKQLA